jgi:hypothetical protein
VVVKFKGKKIELYINVASPFIICDDVIKYIDLDLDYFVADINVDKIDLLDEDEYKQNIVIYRYSDKLQKIIANTCKKIITLFNDGSLKKCYNTKLLTLTAINEYRNKIIVFQKFNKQFNKLVLAKKVASAQELLDKFVLDNPSICAISRSKIQSLKDELTKTSTNKTLDSSDFAFSLLKKQCEALLKKHDYDHAQAAIMEFNTNDPISAFQNNDKVSALQREISFAKKNSEKNQIEKQFQNADIPTQLKKIYNGHSLNFG